MVHMRELDGDIFISIMSRVLHFSYIRLVQFLFCVWRELFQVQSRRSENDARCICFLQNINSGKPSIRAFMGRSRVSTFIKYKIIIIAYIALIKLSSTWKFRIFVNSNVCLKCFNPKVRFSAVISQKRKTISRCTVAFSYRNTVRPITSFGSRCRRWLSEIWFHLRVESGSWRWPVAIGNSGCDPGSDTWWIQLRWAAAGPRLTVGTVMQTDWRRSEVRQPTPRDRTSSFSLTTSTACVASSSSACWSCPRRHLGRHLPVSSMRLSLSVGFLRALLKPSAVRYSTASLWVFPGVARHHCCCPL